MAFSTHQHSFHIPVMGLAYTIDTPIRIAHLGINSVVSLGDDVLIERVRKFYSQKFDFEFIPILSSELDARAKRITSYLNLMHKIVVQKFEEHKVKLATDDNYLNNFLELLPDYSTAKRKLIEFGKKLSQTEFLDTLHKTLNPGKIDVNIMTKLDKTNYHENEALPIKYNDGHSSFRAFADSNLSSSVVLSAGMNPKLFSYMAEFNDFLPDASGNFKKEVIIKVSDYRSAFIQGKLLANKGIWVSEYRVESGLNCGGHAFATQGKLMGPILEEFKNNHENLVNTLFPIYQKALSEKGIVQEKMPAIKITAQGGVGNAEEHDFLLSHYKLNSVGWGSPFLLVPEAVSIDEATRQQLSVAEEKDFYLSNASPLGVPFNNLRKSSRQKEMSKKLQNGKSGSPCTKKFLMLNTEFTDKPICTASTKYHKLKLKQLQSENLSKEKYQEEYSKLMEKECLCGGLSTAFFYENNMDTNLEGSGVTICPGPNLAYFSGKISLRSMIRHIYGKKDVLNQTRRPHMFIKELELYLQYLLKELDKFQEAPSNKAAKYLNDFQANLLDGIDYYKFLFQREAAFSTKVIQDALEKLNHIEDQLKSITVSQNSSVLT
ncbi:hypothetical protein MATR_34300 [Marivirga tractuosa]|uniref:Uncharacterized protein n=1 Tax=Marivirga tractuosa (strain ATCC 23168 / DSM 4126 / NBRC 15989 / NCIMB 1408 / VKM B-1430 / H-43) TaxID=643867 RepID=E4TR43_MARTH|nr:hypothetical protein [Marivirga tractuosa]ADR22724.1 hypothetical protein Ftrac_2746 [Marivirga tractuosa DSM 4126]BDD16605.1 hypothetical protein MATR_34300 [Marivirga tractuosa]